MAGLFVRILIANRGEIAYRVIATARRLGIATVAVYSEADENALHVALADEAVPVGPPPVAESYLKGETIIQAALETGAEAIHPGYGFLSENPDFVEKVEAAGLVFIGPPAPAIRAMGLKDAAKKRMEAAGVPVVPGYHGTEQAPDFLAKEAERIGYPVLIKARAGGGGKGMRRVDDPKDFVAALEGAQREGAASFGDPAVLIEKYITAPRHIEVQIFGDNHGNVVHLYERDCSLQRRHQKVIEEAPAPGMTEEMRTAMTGAAVRAGEAIGYSGAGTVEFIVDGSRGLRPDGFWFMEMNTRLQVEHPVTERVTGLDLVEWQLRVAAGEKLPLKQRAITLSGHAFEARLYAEDVPKGFLPATGTLHHLRFPAAARIDSGIRKGDTITPHYDPMIAKIITSGGDREAALDALHAALRDTQIAGTVTNLAFLIRLSRHSGFRQGDVDTGLIDRDRDELVIAGEKSTAITAIAALLAQRTVNRRTGSDPFRALGAFSLWGAREQFADLTVDGELVTWRLASDGVDRYCCSSAESRHHLTLRDLQPNHCSVLVDGRETHVGFARWPGHLSLFADGETHDFGLPDPLDAATGEFAASDRIVAPMPGLVKKIAARTGDAVKKGAALIILEAMKMEHTLVSPRDGLLASLNVAEGDQVDEGTILAALEEAGE